MKRLARLSLMATALVFALGASCDTQKSFEIPKSRELKKGGVYVAYVLGCDEGCKEIKKGDLIQKYDGKTVQTAAELDSMHDGQSHKLELLAKTGEPKTVAVKAKPITNLAPLETAPPLWLVGAEELNRAPEWARERLFGHASPSVLLMNTNGGTTNGRQLFGRRKLMVYWDWGDREEEAAAVAFMQVLQKAQADLAKASVDVMFVHVRFPTGRKAPMNDTDLRAWQDSQTVEEGGQRYNPLPFYRWPNETEFNPAAEVGLEGAFTVFETLARSPSIVVLDERGIVRFHSQGLQEPGPNTDIKAKDQFTIIKAVNFAQKCLGADTCEI